MAMSSSLSSSSILVNTWVLDHLFNDALLLRSDFTLLHRYIRLPRFLFPTPPHIKARVQYDLVLLSCTIQSGVAL